ncbi:hypothetical protein C483_07983 [Natrialba hulunbeirensis JCM 10989]|uniref:eCIS core domain-containing protein n=1 Tax=Natrialba hulunbeirensis JCM 10989 TaxID=1227493 RepID=M0A4V5_9EURY|nr:DUF4157 domain-containing protein [Natrialba hulunbeirensis]ELY92378.1 hypothetical protein C483_07983 [Natrialba hulunbeirensis JCM 10989]
MGRKRKRKRKRTSKSTDADESSESQTKRRSLSSTRSKSRLGPLDGTAAVDQGIGNDINALTGQPEGFDAMAGSNTPDFEPLPTGADAQIQRALEGTDTTQEEVPTTVLDVLGQGGTPLDSPIQRALEERMDADFSNVRVHTGAKAAEAAEAIDAKAFTCGNDIVFNSGEYDTESPEGQHLLAHELAHVKQQNGGAPISMMPKEGADLEIDPDPQLEREADQAAVQALSTDEPLVVSRMGTDVHIQRSIKGKVEDFLSGDQPAFEEGVHAIDDDERGELSESVNRIIDDVKQLKEDVYGSDGVDAVGASKKGILAGGLALGAGAVGVATGTVGAAVGLVGAPLLAYAATTSEELYEQVGKRAIDKGGKWAGEKYEDELQWLKEKYRSLEQKLGLGDGTEHGGNDPLADKK